MRVIIGFVLLLLVVSTTEAARADVLPGLKESLSQCDMSTFDTRLADAVKAAEAAPDDLAAQRAAAEGNLLRANQCRLRLSIGGADKAEVRALEEAKESAAAAGMPAAERALALAKEPADVTQAHRVLGELISHQISGPISGMRNGPKAREHLDEALKLLPQDVECQRAQAIMLLNNPAMFGGDPARAAQILTQCVKLAPGRQDLLLLQALSYQKTGDNAAARAAAEAAVAVNTPCPDASRLLASLD